MAEPPITLRAVHDSGTPNLPPTRYVVHCTAGGLGYPRESAAGRARGTARYFQKQAAGGSAHYIHDAGEAEEHCVPEDVIAWHAPPNPESIGDEICGEPTYTREQWLSDEVWPGVRASALRCREVCDRRGIPKVKLSPADLLAGKHGICGHVDVSNAWHESTHWDPGPNFPWDRYMAVVNGTDEEDDMPSAEEIADAVWAKTLRGAGSTKLAQPISAERVLVESRQISSGVGKAVAALAAKDPTDITAADIAAVIPDDLAQQVVDALAKRLAS